MMKFSVFAATFIASVIFVASSVFAFHGTSRGGGSFGSVLSIIDVILPMIVVVVIGMVGLEIWDRKIRKTKSKRKHKRKRR